ncbi:hypothetical protein ACHAC9_07940 [Massilia sp. CMS3.1]|uniref:hypothetical protein n=1 Tax=Massilia sp. CMS3.1 TaxID=3373083 RepID=UPI003EE48D19
MGSMITFPDLELQRLVNVGLLTKGMNYRIHPSPALLLSFCNRLEGRTIYAEIAYDSLRSPAEIFEMVVMEQIDGQDSELVSLYRHGSLEHAVRVGNGLLCYHSTARKMSKKAEKAVVTVRVDEDLRQAFEAAVGATGESQAVVMRQLMRFFIGKGPDPRLVG